MRINLVAAFFTLLPTKKYEKGIIRKPRNANKLNLINTRKKKKGGGEGGGKRILNNCQKKKTPPIPKTNLVKGQKEEGKHTN